MCLTRSKAKRSKDERYNSAGWRHRDHSQVKLLKNEVRSIMYHLSKYKTAVEELLDDPSDTAAKAWMLHDARWNLDYALDRIRHLMPKDGSYPRIHMKKAGGTSIEFLEVSDPICKRYIDFELPWVAHSFGLEVTQRGINVLEGLLGPSWNANQYPPYPWDAPSASNSGDDTLAETVAPQTPPQTPTGILPERRSLGTTHDSTASEAAGAPPDTPTKFFPRTTAALSPAKRAKTDDTAAAPPAVLEFPQPKDPPPMRPTPPPFPPPAYLLAEADRVRCRKSSS